MALQLEQPTGPLSALVQGLWSASVAASAPAPVQRPLYSDAASGVLFNLAGDSWIGDHRLPAGVMLLPVQRQAVVIRLAPGARLAGIRFHPAAGRAVMGPYPDGLASLTPQQDQPLQLQALHHRLQHSADPIATLYRWCEQTLPHAQPMPGTLTRALADLRAATSAPLNAPQQLSQRQLERQFRHWLTMTPKQFQRIMRIRNSIHHLRQYPDCALADLAAHFGFSDQAHMTREFRAIAGTTPGQLRSG